MVLEDKVRLLKLFDIYGKLLSNGQQEIMSYYLNNDLTISEIAVNLGVSRQAVKDSITKGEKKLNELEEKLNLYGKIMFFEKKICLYEQMLESKKED